MTERVRIAADPSAVAATDAPVAATGGASSSTVAKGAAASSSFTPAAIGVTSGLSALLLASVAGGVAYSRRRSGAKGAAAPEAPAEPTAEGAEMAA